jgi:hypothetical protein
MIFGTECVSNSYYQLLNLTKKSPTFFVINWYNYLNFIQTIIYLNNIKYQHQTQL